MITKPVSTETPFLLALSAPSCVQDDLLCFIRTGAQPPKQVAVGYAFLRSPSSTSLDSYSIHPATSRNRLKHQVVTWFGYYCPSRAIDVDFSCS